jgi:hypothetical protein
MRITSSVTSVSWIPSEAISGLAKMPFEAGITHYDEPPPDGLDGPDALEDLRVADRFRFANELRAWIDVEDGTVVGHGHAGRGHIGVTRVRVGRRSLYFTAFRLPDLQAEPEVGDGWVRFVQTTGGRTGLPAPRRVAHKPFLQYDSPLVWTTLALTIHADGRATSSPRPACSTSSTGTGTPSARTRRGARATPPPSSPRSRPRSSENCPPS